MKVDFTLHGIRFEWDREKADLNLKKHAISFEAAVEAFLDPFVKSCDAEYRDGEVRNCQLAAFVCRFHDTGRRHISYHFRKAGDKIGTETL